MKSISTLRISVVLSSKSGKGMIIIIVIITTKERKIFYFQRDNF